MNSNETASQPAHSEGTKRNLASISPFFIVKDLHASIAHYIERFGFQLDFQGPERGMFYGQVSRDGVALFLKTIARCASVSKPHAARVGSLGRVHLHTGPRPALRRV